MSDVHSGMHLYSIIWLGLCAEFYRNKFLYLRYLGRFLSILLSSHSRSVSCWQRHWRQLGQSHPFGPRFHPVPLRQCQPKNKYLRLSGQTYINSFLHRHSRSSVWADWSQSERFIFTWSAPRLSLASMSSCS